jgi:hypothetical protein
MGRTPTVVSKEELQSVIDKLEGEQTFKNLGDLFKAVEETDWAKGLQPRALKAPVVYSRFKEFGIICKTQPGRKANGECKKEELPKEKGEIEAAAFVQRTGVLGKVIFTPGGAAAVLPPALKLASTDEATVKDWCEKVTGWGERQGLGFTPHALAYLSRQSYDINSPDYYTVKAHIWDWAGMVGMDKYIPPVVETRAIGTPIDETELDPVDLELELEAIEPPPTQQPKEKENVLRVGTTGFGG